MKESEKIDKYLDLARELKRLWDMKMTVIPTIVGTLGTILKSLEKSLKDLEIRGRIKIIQITAVSISTRVI